MAIELGSVSRRLLGVMLEKEFTTPNQYPLSVNGLTVGANQKSNRDPLMSLDDYEVEDRLKTLHREGWAASRREEGARVTKWSHRLGEKLGLEKRELAVLAELLLRGAQQPGELRTRASRMHPFVSLEALEASLGVLVHKGYARKAPRASGERVERFDHTFYPPGEVAPDSAPAPSPAPAPAPAPTPLPTSHRVAPPRAGKGRVEVHEFESRVLAGNPLGDPVTRPLHVYVPPGYDESSATDLPALLALVGFTGTGVQLFNFDPLAESLSDRLDRLITSGKCPPVLVAAPDCFTRLGGNQYINSSATGRYEDYLIEEIVPFVKDRYRTGRWGVFGKSSGGYGAIVQAMRHPELFEAVADHSGDSNFELCYLSDFPEALDKFREAGSPAKWLERFWADPNHKKKSHHKALNALAMAAHYSPNPASPHLGIDFPFDLATGVFRREVWERWREHDPVNMVARHAAALRRSRLVYLDCGTKDEFALAWGMRALAAAIRAQGVDVLHEEFDDGHMSISYRYDRSLPLLAGALSGPHASPIATP